MVLQKNLNTYIRNFLMLSELNRYCQNRNNLWFQLDSVPAHYERYMCITFSLTGLGEKDQSYDYIDFNISSFIFMGIFKK